MANQLGSNNLRNVRQAMVIYNSLNILLAIKHLHSDLGLGHLLPRRISKIERRDDMHLVDKNSVQGDH